MANVTFSYAWTSDRNIIADWLTEDILITSSDGKLNIPFLTTLKVKGFSSVCIYEIYADFLDWSGIDEAESAPKEFTRESILTAMKNIGLLERLGLQDYADDESLIDVMYSIISVDLLVWVLTEGSEIDITK